jgi:hypothetical protein
MNKVKIFYKAVAVLIILLSFFWFWKYDSQMLNINVYGKPIQISMAMYSGYVFLIGFITAIFAFMGTLYTSALKTKEYEKKLSTTSVDSSKDKSKIEALERKIATLEKALESKIEEK